MLLDTDVLSELMRREPAQTVLSWLDAQPAGSLYICTVTQAEVALGLALLPEGRRRQALALAAQQMFEEDFADRCLAFDTQAALCYGEVVAGRRRAGLPISAQDAMIVATALANGMPLATRNVKDFAGITGLALANPWSTGS